MSSKLDDGDAVSNQALFFLQPQRPDWDGQWNAYGEKHREWVQGLPKEEAVYVLPKAVVDELTSVRGPHRKLSPLLTERQAAAEHDFTKLCQAHSSSTVGVIGGRPLEFSLLAGLMGNPIDCPKCRLPSARHVDPATDERLKAIERRRLAYAGALVLHNPYRQELARLKSAWNALPDPKPDLGPWAWEVSARQSEISSKAIGYYRRFDCFRSRWHLLSMASWDLPLPMVHMTGISAIMASHVFGMGGSFDYTPPFSDTQRVTVPQKQKQRHSSYPTYRNDPELPLMSASVDQGTGPSQHATRLRMFLVELTLRRHYGNPHGMVAALIRGFQKWLELEEDHLSKRLRRIYAPYVTAG